MAGVEAVKKEHASKEIAPPKRAMSQRTLHMVAGTRGGSIPPSHQRASALSVPVTLRLSSREAGGGHRIAKPDRLRAIVP
jgi:hypothetical protein